jgi:beta-1,4-N-acetylglucosaminyltransferase
MTLVPDANLHDKRLTGHSNLKQALEDSEVLRKKSKEFPPANSGVHRQATGLAGIIDEELGILD